MAHLSPRLLAAPVLALFALLVVAASASAEETNAEIMGHYFVPDHIVVYAGDSISWVNHDEAPHTVVLDGSGDSTPTIPNEGMATLTFAEPGMYEFHCGIHPSMKGIVEVLPRPDEGPNDPPTITSIDIMVEGLSVHLAAHATDPEGTPLGYGWHFGDGNATLYTEPANQRLTHTYDAPGTYVVTLYVTDNVHNLHDSRQVTVGASAGPLTEEPPAETPPPTTAEPTPDPAPTTAEPSPTPTAPTMPTHPTAGNPGPAPASPSPTPAAPSAATAATTKKADSDTPGLGLVALLGLAAVAALAFRRRA